MLKLLISLSLIGSAAAEDQLPSASSAVSEEMRTVAVAKLREAMLSYPMTGGIFVDTSMVPPRITSSAGPSQ